MRTALSGRFLPVVLAGYRHPRPARQYRSPTHRGIRRMPLSIDKM